MYAIVKCGGKQYKVEKDMLVKVEKIDAEVGAKVELEVLLVADDKGNVKAGADAAGAKVEAVVNAQGKFPKIDVFHYIGELAEMIPQIVGIYILVPVPAMSRTGRS